MENLTQREKGKLKIITFHVMVILCIAILIHYSMNGILSYHLQEFKFPHSLALATGLRLSFIHLKM